MRKYLYCENGFVEKPQWMPNCWVNVECPDQSDFEFLTKELKVPEAFLEDIADMDERPRTDTEDNWLRPLSESPCNNREASLISLSPSVSLQIMKSLLPCVITPLK